MAEHKKHNEHRQGGLNLPHHFDTVGQFNESGKLGMWLFLVTEVMMFGGLFCGYAIFRVRHPEIFIYAHRYLNPTLGGINTAVLIFSSLTMAWAVRAAMLSQKKILVIMLGLTFLCACGFMSIKGVEYHEKWQHGLLWARQYNPKHEGAPHGVKPAPAPAAKPQGGGEAAADIPAPAGNPLSTHTSIPAAAAGPTGLSPRGVAPETIIKEQAPANVQTFFSIYFLMTGLHGFHVLMGMGVLVWFIIMSARGRYGNGHYLPVELMGLYWHLVDLIWIFLFPLLYLVE
jgi:cytochrome c oxidase subunit 3